MKNENSIEPSDPRLTAYVVGEMDPDETAAFAAELKKSPAAEKEVERIRETAELLKSEFADELDAAFRPKTRVAILPDVPAPDPQKVIRFPEMRTAVMALAAVLIAMAIVTPMWLKRDKDVPERAGTSVATADSETAKSLSTERSADEGFAALAGDLPAVVDHDGVEYLLMDADSQSLAAPAQNAGGFHLAGLSDSPTEPRFDSRYLGVDPIEASGRRLADDPIDPHPVPLPAAAKNPGAVPVNPATYTIDGLDAELAEKLGTAGRVVTMTRRISGDESGEQSRSLFLAEQSADEAGNPQVRITGRVQTQEGRNESLKKGWTEADKKEAMDLAIQTVPAAPDRNAPAETQLIPRPAVTFGAAPAPAKPAPSSGSGASAPLAAARPDDGIASGAPQWIDRYAEEKPPSQSSPEPAAEKLRSLKEFERPMREGKEKAGESFRAGADHGGKMKPDPLAAVPAPAAAPEPVALQPSGTVDFGFSGGIQSRIMFGQEDESPPPTVNSPGVSAGRTVNFAGVSSGGTIELSTIDATGTVVVPTEVEIKGHGNFHSAPIETRSRGRDSSLGRHAPTIDNPFTDPMQTALSTFSVDVDTASYTETRRLILKDGRLPQRDQVRIEDFLNYFEYHSYPAPRMEDVEAGEAAPFSVNLESAAAPWNPVNRIVRIGLKGAEIPAGKRPAANLVFLLDVSGSMKPADKLPLMQKCLREMLPQLREDDRVTMVVYASKAGEVLPPTPGDDRKTIREAIDALSAKGSTNGEGGIRIAYQRARENFIEDGVNRILLATDGDFNVGQDSDAELVSLIEKEAKSGIFLTVLGFGTGNLNDSMLEKITNKGNGQFHYIDRLEEGRRVLVEQMDSSLVTIAKDVKIQVEFNAGRVAAWRLIGYANRLMPREDFHDDTKDAGEIGAGHTVTALYEVVPVEALMQLTQAEEVEGLKYKKKVEGEDEEFVSPFEQRRRLLKKEGIDLVDSPELLTVKLNYKRPDSDESEPDLEFPLVDPKVDFAKAGKDFRFAAAVATFGMRLRNHDVLKPWHDGQTIRQFESIARIANGAIEGDEFDRKKEFVEMVKAAAKLSGGTITLDGDDEDPADEPPADGDVGKTVKDKLNELR